MDASLQTARREGASGKFAVVLNVVCGVSYEKIGKLFGTSGVAVLKWVQAGSKR